MHYTGACAYQHCEALCIYGAVCWATTLSAVPIIPSSAALRCRFPAFHSSSGGSNNSNLMDQRSLLLAGGAFPTGLGVSSDTEATNSTRHSPALSNSVSFNATDPEISVEGSEIVFGLRG